ncbi:MAG: hypothetical protein PHD81_04330 [Candidatus Nanoarchaeia archaeon]|nr:hypothetical protein [Candidatus Nanoarchaeia archaeon]MDD5588305.1 hypothetical protein [Candidatus Nanoarchaeia archaeon]
MTDKICLYDELGEIFDPLNKKVCSPCSDRGYLFMPHGCCSSCSYSKGHYQHRPDSFKLIKILYCFDEKEGFFDVKNNSCKLPRQLRSIICLEYICRAMLVKLSRENLKRIDELMAEIKEDRRNNKNFPY